jgi:hypothetical protein
MSAGETAMRTVERLVIAAVLALAVVSGAQTADPALPAAASSTEGPAAPR